jgi:hypothetical protein
MHEFAERARSYLADAMRSKDPQQREQYLELAACCVDAAARHAKAAEGSARPRRSASPAARANGATRASAPGR